MAGGYAADDSSPEAAGVTALAHGPPERGAEMVKRPLNHLGVTTLAGRFKPVEHAERELPSTVQLLKLVLQMRHAHAWARSSTLVEAVVAGVATSSYSPRTSFLTWPCSARRVHRCET